MLYLRLLIYFFKEGFKDLIRNKSINIFAIFIVALSFTIFGFSRYITSNIKNITSNWLSHMEVRVVLKNELNLNEIQKIIESINRLAIVEETKIVSPEEALKLIEKISPTLKSYSFLENENPLPYSISIKLKKGIKEDEIKNSFEILKKVDGIEEVAFDFEWLNKIKKYSNFLTVLSGIFFILFGLTSLFTISSITRIIALSRKDEISILYSLGATPASIRGPFITEGILIGFLSSMISIFILFLIHLVLQRMLSDSFILMVIADKFISIEEQIFIIFSGTIMGALGGFFSIPSIEEFKFGHRI